MDSCPSNSYKAREESALASQKKKQITKVTKGTVRTKKKNEMSKLGGMLISEDASKVKSYILMDVLVPTIKKAISDIVKNGVDMILYGEVGQSNKRTYASTVSYRDYYDNGGRSASRFDDPPRARTRAGYSFDDVILETRGEAEEVLSSMDELIETYGSVSVADMYDLVGISCEYTDNKYGWKNIRTAEPVRVRDGYMLKLPRALPLN